MSTEKSGPKYKKYSFAIEKCLQSFKSINEWADMISFLTKVIKTLQAFPGFSTIPKKVLVGKRLAQCLNTALPPGVHQKALETYAVIFEKLGRDKLSSDFAVYSHGILPFFKDCSISVRGTYLAIFKRHLIPLAQSNPGCLEGLVLALLPGIEENGNEFFDQVRDCLCELEILAGETLFYRCIWSCLFCSTHHRLGTINLLPLKPPPPDYVCRLDSKDRGLMARAVGGALYDTKPLVVRGSLELVLKYFAPKNIEIFGWESYLDICRAVLHVLLRRDISLSRRCTLWMQGQGNEPQNNEESGADSRMIELISETLRNMLHVQDLGKSETISLFKILISILDQAEIGNQVCRNIMLDIVTSIYLNTRRNYSVERLDVGNMFFEVVDLYLVWSSLYKSLNDIDDFSVDFCGVVLIRQYELFDVFQFSISNLKIWDNEAGHLHLPFFLHKLLKLGVKKAQASFWELVVGSIKTSALVVSKIPASYFRLSSSEEMGQFVLSSIVDQYYLAEPLLTAPFTKALVMELVAMIECLLRAMNNSVRVEACSIFDGLSLVFRWIVNGYPVLFVEPKDLELWEQVLDALMQRFFEFDQIQSKIPVLRMMLELISLDYYQSLGRVVAEQTRSIFQSLWDCFCQVPGQSAVVELFWAVQKTFATDCMDRFFSSMLTLRYSTLEQRGKVLERFSTFWLVSEQTRDFSCSALEKSVHVMIDTMHDVDRRASRLARYWLRNNIERPVYFSRLLSMFFRVLSRPEFQFIVRKPSLWIQYRAEAEFYQLEHLDFPLVHHVLKRLQIVIGSGVPDRIWTAEPVRDMLALIFDKMVHFGCTETKDRIDCGIAVADPISIQLTALELAELVVKRNDVVLDQIQLEGFSVRILNKLCYAVWLDQLELHPILLRIVLLLIEKEIIDPKTDLRMGILLQDENSDSPFQKMVFRGLSAPDPGILEAWIRFIEEFGPRIGPRARYFIFTLIQRKVEELQDRPEPHLDVWVIRSLVQIFPILETGESKPEENSGGIRLWNGLFGTMLWNEPLAIRNPVQELYFVSNSSCMYPFEEKVLIAMLQLFTYYFDQEGQQDLTESLSHISNTIYMNDSWLYISLVMHLWNHLSKWYQFVDAVEIADSELNRVRVIVEMARMVQVTPSIFVHNMLEWYREVFFSTGQQRLTKHGGTNNNPILETMVLSFLEWYTYFVEEVELATIWNLVGEFYKECLSNAVRKKASLMGLLRWISLFAFRFGTADQFAGQFRDCQDILSRLIDATVVLASRLTADGHGKKDWTSDLASNFGRYLDEEYPLVVLGYIDCRLVPNLGKLVHDQEKIGVTMGNLFYYFLHPIIKSRLGTNNASREFSLSIRLLYKICELFPFTNKHWKKELHEYFLDARFFGIVSLWKQERRGLVSFMFQDDLEKLAELAKSISTSHSSSIFSSRDQESYNRTLAVKRVAYAVYSCEKDMFVQNLPLLREKTVELFKLAAQAGRGSSFKATTLCSLFLLLRCILMRFSAKFTANWWPLIISEILMFFKDWDADNEFELDTMFAILKFLELCYWMQPEEFLCIRWIFHCRDETSPSIFGLIDSKLPASPPDTLSSSIVLTSARYSLEQTRKFLANIDREGHVPTTSEVESWFESEFD